MAESARFRNPILVTAAMAGAGLLLAASACSPAGDTLPLSVDDGAAMNNLELAYDLNPDSTSIATITAPEGKLAMTIHGTKTTDGSIEELTGISGISQEGVAFSATFNQDGSSAFVLPALRLDVVQISGEELQITGTVISALKRTPTGADQSFDVRVLADLDTGLIQAELDLCPERNCPPPVVRDLKLLRILGLTQLIFVATFNERCIKSEALSPETCLALMGLGVDLGDSIQKIIACNPDLPSSIRQLSSGTCGQNDTGNSNSNTNGNTNDNTFDNQNDHGGTIGNDNNNDNGGATGGGTGDDVGSDDICGSYPADGSGLPNWVVVYGDYDVYWGEPVADSDAPIYVGHYFA